jgi:hypothetical protein
MMITASTSMKLPNVSWPIDNENDRFIGEFDGNSEVMLSGPGSNRPQYTTLLRPRGTHPGPQFQVRVRIPAAESARAMEGFPRRLGAWGMPGGRCGGLTVKRQAAP